MSDAYRKAVKKYTRALQKAEIDFFFESFDETKETVILLPGGMGSQLYRADKPFEDQTSRYTFSEIWLDIGFICRAKDGRWLEINREGLDLERRIIAANEDTQFVTLNPYLKALRFFRGKAGFNTVFLAWDWRRDLRTAADALNDLMTDIKRKAESYNNPQQVMERVFIVGHSMGGMVAKLFFENHPVLAEKIGGMISVGTPFYGYFSHLHHVFEGHKLMNKFYKAKTVARITATLTGLHTLFPIDEKTWERYGECIGLPEYPLKDLEGKNADAYKKGAPPFPNWVRPEKLKCALKVHQCISRKLPDSLVNKVHHIRGSKEKSTPLTATWDQDLPAGYDPDNPKKYPSPITDGRPKGPGDETIPYWSAALCDTPKEQIIDFDQAKHMKLMEQTFVLQQVLRIVSRGVRSLNEEDFVAEYGPEAEIATTEELDEFLNKVDLTRAKTDQQLKTLMPEKYVWRFFQDLSK